MNSISTDELYAMLHQLKEDYSSSMPMGQKYFNLQAFHNQGQNTIPPTTTESIDDLLELIEPLDFPSKRLKLELANKLKRPLIILDYIKKEEKLLVKRALQFSWMYEQGNSPLSNPKTLVRVILPGLSYSTRLKIISGLSRNLRDETACQEMFKLVQEKFGTFSALELLPSCSKTFIKDLLESNGYVKINLTPQQALKIAKKDINIAVELMTYLLDYLRSSLSENSYGTKPGCPEETKYKMYEDKLCEHFRKVVSYNCSYICKKHPHEFVKLYQKYSDLINIKNTPQITKVLMAFCKDEILPNASLFLPILNPKIVAKLLEWTDLINFIQNILPDQIELFLVESSKFLQWLQPLRHQKQSEALSQGFLKKYGSDILLFPEFIPPNVMNFMPPEARNSIATQKIKFNDPGRITFTSWEDLPKHREGFWCSFMTLDKSIPKIKVFLSKESDGVVRTELLTYLVKTCSINGKDKKSILDICRFVLLKYRNDTYQVRQGFLSALHHEFKLDNWMDSDIWEVLIEFIKLAEAYKEPQQQFLTIAAVRFHLIKDRPMETLFKGVVKSLVSSCYGIQDWNWFSNSAELEEKFLKLMIVEMAKLYPEETPLSNYTVDQTLPNALVTLLTRITNWKRRNGTISSRFLFQDYPWLINRILEIARTIDGSTFDDIHLKILQAVRPDPELLNLCLDIYIEINPFAPVVELLLSKDPARIQQHLSENIAPFILELDDRQFKTYKQFLLNLKEYPEIASAFVEICLEAAQDEGQEDNARIHSLTILSYLWDSRNYLHTLSLFYPTSPTIDLSQDGGFETRFQAKKAVVQSLTNTSFPADCLEPVEKFCIGDYVKTSVGPLFSSCLHSPKHLATKFLREELIDRPVAVKKLAMKLFCTISDQEEVEEFVTYLWENETHPTIREIVVSELLTFMLQNPSAKSWSLVKAIVLSPTFKEEGVIQELFLPHRIAGLSTDVLVDYLITCHQILTKQLSSSNNNLRASLFEPLIQAVSRNAELFSSTFLEALIIENLLETGQSDVVLDLAIAYIVLADNETNMSCRINVVSDKIVKLKDKWDEVEITTINRTVNGQCFEKPLKSYVARQALSNFVEAICKGSIRKVNENPLCKSICKQILSSILDTISRNFEPSETFGEELYLNMLLIIFETVQDLGDSHRPDPKCLHKVGQKIQNLTDTILKKYHPAIFSLYFERFLAFFKEIYEVDLNDCSNSISLLLGIVSSMNEQAISIENKVLVCQLLPDSSPRTPELETRHLDLLTAIGQFACNTTKAYLAENLKSSNKTTNQMDGIYRVL